MQAHLRVNQWTYGKWNATGNKSKYGPVLLVDRHGATYSKKKKEYQRSKIPPRAHEGGET
jgi:hypothetical protein